MAVQSQINRIPFNNLNHLAPNAIRIVTLNVQQILLVSNSFYRRQSDAEYQVPVAFAKYEENNWM